MKKLISVLVACLLVSGCGAEKVTCTYDMDVAGQKMKAEMIAPVENGKITKVTTKMTVELSDEKTAKSYCDQAKEDKDAKVTCNGKKVTTEATEENKDEPITKKDFIKEMEDEGFKCK